MNGKIYRLIFILILAIVIILYFYSKNNLYYNDIKIGEFNCKYNIYSVGCENIFFYRSQINPTIFKKYDWLPAATAKLGGAFLTKMSKQELKSLFEKPPENPEKYVPQLLSQTNIDSTIKVVGLIKFEINSNTYLYVSLKTSDLPNYVQYTLLKKIRNHWVIPANKQQSIIDFHKTAKKIHNLIINQSEIGKCKYISLSSLGV